ncbi:acyl-CoA thioesterase II [Sphingopyxis sp. JAI128]|uniref:acyl-CoA thioesterase n=1 Tax=Sphingopyxis sp. JAI128 TaxID=2723066 RepID=UPI001607D252|nr:thioesterase family protein [Sphingopyxis sp. JAI128]MBB6426848.1 acyl-CoA thioesterase [Sphingopyxis sp. JAI128]
MTSPNFPDLRIQAPARWALDVEPALSTGPLHRQHLFGGASLALAVAALEEVTGGDALWASVHFLAPVPTGATLDIEARITGGGRAIGHGAVEARLDDVPILSGLGSCGRAGGGDSGQWAQMPATPPPADCDLLVAHKDADRDIHSTLDIRVAAGRFGIFSRAPLAPGGRVQAWMRHRRRANDRVALAFMSDFVPSTVGNAIGVRAGGNSLDNNIRYCGTGETEWVLGDFSIDALSGGVGHGRVHLFAENGTLLATGSQSFKLRAMPRADEDRIG